MVSLGSGKEASRMTVENLCVQERSWLPVSGRKESLRAVEEVTTWWDQERSFVEHMVGAASGSKRSRAGCPAL